MVAVRPYRAGVGMAVLIATLAAAPRAFPQTQDAPESAPASEATAGTPAAAPAEGSATADPELAVAMEEGHTEYLKNCRACHGSKGTAGVPLAGNEKVEAGFDYLAWAIITGPGYMPDFGAALSDEQIALISTYILNSWGNEYGMVLAEDISALR